MSHEPCPNKVEVYIERKDKFIEISCGSTNPQGELALCDSCIAKYEKMYPQGWRHTPGDLCKHGNYVGDSYGPDYMCELCESGA